MRIIAIDPGNTKSAYVCFYNGEPVEFDIIENNLLLRRLNQFTAEMLAIEMVACYGMAVGKSVFDTCVWIGRFVERWNKPYRYIYRLDEKMHLCHDSRAKDANVRQAIIDRYPATGGGAIPQIGTKKQPGPLYGVSKDIWSALAVALTAIET